MRIGEILRYARPYDPVPEMVDGLPNYFNRTHSPGHRLPLLESGINPIQKINSSSGQLCPAILISSSPHKIGSIETPWQDFFDPDNGHIRYNGDNKSPGLDPSMGPGNKALLEQFDLHTAPERRKRLDACPIVCFRRVRIGARAKGNVQFQGFGVIARAERITQYDRKQDRSFINYVFDFTVFSLKEEQENFDWRWISARRDPSLSSEETRRFAPLSWRTWVNEGSSSLDKIRRRVVKLLTKTTQEQKPEPGSPEARALQVIYKFYLDKKTRFEALAALVTARIIRGDGHSYRHGWITPSSSDGGADFVGRLDIGTGMARAKLIVLGQAKCETFNPKFPGNLIGLVS